MLLTHPLCLSLFRSTLIHWQDFWAASAHRQWLIPAGQSLSSQRRGRPIKTLEIASINISKNINRFFKKIFFFFSFFFDFSCSRASGGLIYTRWSIRPSSSIGSHRLRFCSEFVSFSRGLEGPRMENSVALSDFWQVTLMRPFNPVERLQLCSTDLLKLITTE